MDLTSVEGNGLSRRVVIQGSLAAGLATGIGATFASVPAFAAGAELSARIDVSKRQDPIQKYVYGAFIEHIGTLVYEGLWSEVLGDRKFYYPIDLTGAALRWHPVGAAAALTMDTHAPYVGEQSPMVELTRNERRGITQAGLTLAAKEYVGRIVIAGDPGAHVSVTLSWGDAPGQRQSVEVHVRKEWATVPLKFIARAATTNGRLEISGTGTGRFRVGAVSLMPADNVHGFRKDTIALLREVNGGFWRFPGGNFVSGHDWRNAIGDPDKRPTTLDPDRNQVQPNDVGTDEFLTMCALLGTEPYPCVNTGFGSAREAAQMVEYVNGAADTPMGKLRAQNGHPKPYGVKYWAVGNEMFGYWQLGYMTPAHYMIKHNLFAEAMKKIDPTISIVAVGAFPASMTIHRLPYYIDPSTRKIVQPTPVDVAYGSDTDWNYRLLKTSPGNVDVISEHCYGTTQRFDLEQGKYVDVSPPESVVDSCRRGANYIRAVRENWELYQKDFPELQRDQIKVSIDEWGFQKASGLKQLLGIGMMLHEMFRGSDFITMAAYTMGTSWLSYSRSDATYSGAGLLFKLYRQRFGVTPVELTGNSPQPAPTWPVGGDQPKINAGSSTYPLDVMAALTEDGRTLTLAAINATADTQRLDLSVAGFASRPTGTLWRLTGASLDAINRVGQPPQITVTEETFDTGAGVTVAPYSVEIRAFSRR